jgi:hypothetical protein
MRYLFASDLKSWSDMLFLQELAELKGSINLRDYSRIEDKKYLSELVGIEDESWLKPDMAQMIKSQPPAKQWASKIEIKLFNLAFYYCMLSWRIQWRFCGNSFASSLFKRFYT